MYIYMLILTILILMFRVLLVLIRKMNIGTVIVLLIMRDACFRINVVDLNCG